MAERWSGLRVLVVDDDPDHRFLMSKRLQAVGMRPDTTGDPGEVMEKLASSDIVLLDYKIPGTSGIDLLGQIFRANGPPVVMVTGMGSEAVAVEALQAGAVDYVIKTSTYLDELPTVVEEAWRKHDVDRRADALQTIAMLVTSATDSEEVVKGITTGARRLLAADRVEMVFDEASRARRKRLPSSPVLQLDVPIVASTGERIGTIAVHTKEPRTYSTDDCELVETFASFAAIGLANARTIQEERDAVGELKDTLDMRRQLVAAVGHELRTPLTSIAGFSSTLLRHWDSFGDEERRQMIERIDRNSHDLTDIVTRLMDYAYIDSGQMQAQIEELQLADEIEELLDALGATLAGASVEVAVPVAAVAADRVLLRRVLVNLLTNAKKYGGEHSAVIISVELSGDLAKVSVTDQGPGIAADELPNVFEAFWRSGRDHQKRQGTGIGLALVQDYTRLMGGTVGVESVVGTGTTFWFTLPLAQPLSSENE